VKLRHLSNWQRARQSHAAEYGRLFSQIPALCRRSRRMVSNTSNHQYTIRVEQRDALQKFLSERKIGSTVYYPCPLHLQPLYTSLGHKAGDFPHAERAAQEVLSLRCTPNCAKSRSREWWKQLPNF